MLENISDRNIYQRISCFFGVKKKKYDNEGVNEGMITKRNIIYCYQPTQKHCLPEYNAHPSSENLWCFAVFSNTVQLHTQRIPLTVMAEFLCYSVTSEFMTNQITGTCIPGFLLPEILKTVCTGTTVTPWKYFNKILKGSFVNIS